jgi:hypothetical protein
MFQPHAGVHLIAHFMNSFFHPAAESGLIDKGGDSGLRTRNAN